MNEQIEQIFKNFTVDGKAIPVKFLYYHGHGEPYVTYMNTSSGESLSGDDDILGYVAYYDFDVYAKGNYTRIMNAVFSKLKEAGWTFQPSMCSEDMYEEETGYFHKTLCFAMPVEMED